MADVPFAYGYADKVRDVSDVLARVNQASPRLISIVGIAGYRAKQHKHEWPELVLSPEQTTASAAVASTSTQTIHVASKAPFTVNAICRITNTGEQIRVLEIAAGSNQITAQRGYGGTTAANIPKDAVIVVVTKPKLESTTPDHKGDATAPSIAYNFTEIFDAEAVVSMSQGNIYGIGANSTDPIGDGLNFQVDIQTRHLSRRMNNALIHGRRVERTASTPGTMMGLLQAHEGSNNIIPAAGADISTKLLGDAFQKCFDGGAESLDTILCGAVQARKISALYKDKLTILRQETTLGAAIYQVRPDMPIEGYVSTIVVDPTMPAGYISIFDKGRIKLVPQRPLSDKDSTPNGADFVARRIIGEYTAEYNAWKETAALITGLSEVIAS